MSLWWWPGLIVVDTAVIRTLPDSGWWVAAVLVALALGVEFAMSGRQLVALLPPVLIMCCAVVGVVMLSWLGRVG